MNQKHFSPQPLISFRKLAGGLFGTLDVQAVDRHSAQFALGSDFVRLSRAQWVALRGSVDRFFGTEAETVVVTQRERIVVDDEGDVVDDEVEVERIPTPPPRKRGTGRRASGR